MIKDLQILDKELSKANKVTILKRDFTMYERKFAKEVELFIKDVEKISKKNKANQVKLIAAIIE